LSESVETGRTPLSACAIANRRAQRRIAPLSGAQLPLDAAKITAAMQVDHQIHAPWADDKNAVLRQTFGKRNSGFDVFNRFGGHGITQDAANLRKIRSFICVFVSLQSARYRSTASINVLQCKYEFEMMAAAAV
jgi:hypothetical protein